MNTKKFFFYLLAALLCGCLPVMSLHPLFTEKDTVFNEKLLGTWVDPNSPKTTWEFKRADANENAYRLIFSDEEGKKGLFVAHLVKLKDKLFLDVHLGESPVDAVEKLELEVRGEVKDPNKVNFWVYNALFLVPAHTFIRVNSVEPQLKMLLTDDEKMEELLKADPNAVKHDFLDDGPSPILTASTKELQAFILKYADDSRVFTEAMVL
ncbi:MAG: hypothetical protein NTX52_13990, partial [Planctomycetota bacterium]|nr:hypothetical protein [Planctomycetota bacterium]